MFEREPESPPPTSSTSAAGSGSVPAERIMRIAPLDLRQHRFRKSVRGFDQTEVATFLTEAADDYEHALREIDRLRQDLARMETALAEHREREETLRNTLLTAQRLSDEVRESARKEADLSVREAQGRAELIVREAQGRADVLTQNAQNRLEAIERDITELRLRRRGVEGSLEASIQALYHALEFIRDQDRPGETPVAQAAPGQEPERGPRG